MASAWLISAQPKRRMFSLKSGGPGGEQIESKALMLEAHYREDHGFWPVLRQFGTPWPGRVLAAPTQ
jgi:hypothetical protein